MNNCSIPGDHATLADYQRGCRCEQAKDTRRAYHRDRYAATHELKRPTGPRKAKDEYNPRHAANYVDTRHLRSFRFSPEQIADRLGVTVGALVRAAYRADDHELASWLQTDDERRTATWPTSTLRLQSGRRSRSFAP